MLNGFENNFLYYADKTIEDIETSKFADIAICDVRLHGCHHWISLKNLLL